MNYIIIKIFNIMLSENAALANKQSANVFFFRKSVLTNEEKNEQGFEKQYNIKIIRIYLLFKKATLAIHAKRECFFLPKVSFD